MQYDKALMYSYLHLCLSLSLKDTLGVDVVGKSCWKEHISSIHEEIVMGLFV